MPTLSKAIMKRRSPTITRPFTLIRRRLRYSRRGLAYAFSGSYRKAIDDFDQALHLDPKDAATFNDRGQTQQLTGEYDKAITDCNEALRSIRGLRSPTTLGALLVAQGDDERAWPF